MVKEKISEHIAYSEAIASATGERLGIKNVPTEAVLKNMRITAENIFEPLRKHFAQPIRVISFFRCPELNKAVGGATNSQHMTGEAMDLRGTGDVTNAQIFDYIKNNLPFDQLIWEFGNDNDPSWVHVSFSRKPRKNVLKAVKLKGKTIYKKI